MKMSKCYISNSGHRIKAPHSLRVPPNGQAFTQAASAAKNTLPPTALPTSETHLPIPLVQNARDLDFFPPHCPSWMERPWPWQGRKRGQSGLMESETRHPASLLSSACPLPSTEGEDNGEIKAGQVTPTTPTLNQPKMQ